MADLSGRVPRVILQLMARPLRLDVPGVPQHVVVRGVDGQPCFHADSDRAAYLVDLARSAREQQCAVHAYVLMSNHVHLLLTGAVGGAVSRLVQSVGRRYVPRFNESWNRTGALFQGRFHSSIVESARYLLTCMSYIELNPVRAGMVESPLAYRWSSAHVNTGRRRDEFITFHEEYRRLGRCDADRGAAYRAILEHAPDATQLKAIRGQVNRNRVLGDAAFQAMIAREFPRRGEFPATVRRLRADGQECDVRLGSDPDLRV